MTPLVMQCDRCDALLGNDANWTSGWVSEIRAGQTPELKPAEQIWHITITGGTEEIYLCAGCRHAILQLGINRLIEVVS